MHQERSIWLFEGSPSLVPDTVRPEAPDLDSVREALERLAQEHSGEYDGHEVEVAPSPA